MNASEAVLGLCAVVTVLVAVMSLAVAVSTRSDMRKFQAESAANRLTDQTHNGVQQALAPLADAAQLLALVPPPGAIEVRTLLRQGKQALIAALIPIFEECSVDLWHLATHRIRVDPNFDDELASRVAETRELLLIISRTFGAFAYDCSERYHETAGAVNIAHMALRVLASVGRPRGLCSELAERACTTDVETIRDMIARATYADIRTRCARRQSMSPSERIAWSRALPW